MKVFWDTNIFLYLVERHPVFHSKVLSLYDEQLSRGDQLVTSVLTLGELLAQPLRHNRRDLVDRYRSLLTAEIGVELAVFDRPAADHYAGIRSRTSVCQPDAIQLACAAACGAGTFVTNDQRLWNLTVPGVEAIRGL